MKLTLAFSPCPNDTYIFDALVNGLIDTEVLSFSYELDDVEGLNKKALETKYDITKISFGVLHKVLEKYEVLTAGSALGTGVGPLLISKDTYDKKLLSSPQGSVAIPGENTTANLLFSLAYPEVRNKISVNFAEIESLVANGKVTAGVIIHENRFTYEQKGLKKWLDLGAYWEAQTKLPIPLGGIIIRKELPIALKQKINKLIRNSLIYARKSAELSSFVKRHAQEMDPGVQKKHIDLYVNEYSLDLGESGRKAIETLLVISKGSTPVQSDRKPDIFVS